MTRVGALAVGVAALELGAGRRTKADAIDHSVGVLCFAKRGDAVLAAYTIADGAPPERGIVLDVLA